MSRDFYNIYNVFNSCKRLLCSSEHFCFKQRGPWGWIFTRITVSSNLFILPDSEIFVAQKVYRRLKCSLEYQRAPSFDNKVSDATGHIFFTRPFVSTFFFTRHSMIACRKNPRLHGVPRSRYLPSFLWDKRVASLKVHFCDRSPYPRPSPEYYTLAQIISRFF